MANFNININFNCTLKKTIILIIPTINSSSSTYRGSRLRRASRLCTALEC
jgi:hypothetical protein